MIREISIIERCSIKYRTEQFEKFGIGGCDHSYLLCVCMFPGISQEQIAKRVVVNKSNVTRTLARLEQLKLIKRKTEKTDKRVIKVYPTPLGEEVLEQVMDIQNKWEQFLTSGLDENEKKCFETVLKKIYNTSVSYILNKDN